MESSSALFGLLQQIQTQLNDSIARIEDRLDRIESSHRTNQSTLDPEPNSKTATANSFLASPTFDEKFSSNSSLSVMCNALLTTNHFSLLNLNRCYDVVSKKQLELASYDESGDHHSPSEIEIVLFSGPPSFQAVIVENHLVKCKVLSWLFGDLENTYRIPAAIGLCKILSGCCLCGEIPSEIGAMESLTAILLGDNDLTGEIPMSICKLSHLKDLDLSGARQIAFEAHMNERLDRLEANFIHHQPQPTTPDANDLAIHTTDTFTAMETHLSSIASTLESSAQSFSHSSHEVACQLQRLQNTRRKFFTQLSDIPRELATKILAYIPPTEVFRLRRVSMAMNALLLTKHFSFINLERFAPPRQFYEIPTHTEDPHIVTEIEQTFFLGPSSCRTVFAESHLNSAARINWRLNQHDSLIFHIPESIGLCTALVTLDLSRCGLQGEIPAEIGDLARLTHLNLSYNKLSGEVPSELGKLILLREINLSSNFLSGRIPRCLSHLTTLERINLHTNAFTGRIPKYFGNYLPDLKDLILGGNELSGTIPVSLGKLTRLERLHLQGNRLSGNVPRDILLLNVKECELEGNEGLTCDFEFLYESA
ncbi:hypothetical protein HDU98_006813 [Podochytrium sp. JEL0797]|nr:hypothetical protein HDU98_006813 [Podochytrium sp. JEL0797]